MGSWTSGRGQGLFLWNRDWREKAMDIWELFWVEEIRNAKSLRWGYAQS